MNDIDDLIRKCQMKSRAPSKIIEWIPYNSLQNIEYLTKGGFSKIYTTDWIGGRYERWNTEQQRLTISNKISDLELCGPADKPLKSIYGILPYIALEVIVGKGYTFSSDIYSIAMIMWEISTGQPPFINCKHNFDLAMDIVNAQIESIYQFENLPEPKNTTEEEQEAFHSKYSFNIPEKIDDFIKSNDKNNDNTSKTNSDFKVSKVFHKLHIISSDNNQNNYERKITKQRVKKQSVDDNDEIYNNPNLHLEEQEELEIPDVN
ncbi:hypothetical protein RclHR1_09640008 [Rhizophagus clarus]|uniref:Protein kinase domain-containing protein n=1 Tax=Rhizophagus clarus TaxID=94130 RepID=A0A2Z6SQJ7_9GLOM|nr:hypothetical protein RclHR1_09640008 [Rhizophagus clarus]